MNNGESKDMVSRSQKVNTGDFWGAVKQRVTTKAILSVDLVVPQPEAGD